jgi:tRNA(fMet)-specific endonuclease VapC
VSVYVLDTDTLTLFEEGHPAVLQRVEARSTSDLAITVLSVEEQLSGRYTHVRKAKNDSQPALAYSSLAKAVRFLSRLQILDFDEPARRRCEQLRKAKIKIGRMDLWIAAVVPEHGAILVSRNIRDFRKVPGLQIEDWSA